MCTLSLLSQEAMSQILLGSVSVKQVVDIGILVRIRYMVEYPNGYTVSIVKNMYANGMPMSYGSGDDLWELGVMKDGRLCYDTPVADDVCGFLTADEVVSLAREVRGLSQAQPLG